MKIIDDNPLAVFNTMIKNRNEYQFVTNEQKDKYFFIINRNMSKKYPYLAQLINDKTINKSAGMDLWFNFISSRKWTTDNGSYPKWFWSKSDKPTDKPEVTEKENNILLQKFDIKQEELDLIISNYPDEFKEELKYIRDTQKSEKQLIVKIGTTNQFIDSIIKRLN